MSNQPWKGKRIIVCWTDRAFNSGSDWPAFRVIDQLPEGFYCEGVNSPCGSSHDGSTCFIPFKDMNDWQEWKEEQKP